MLIRFGVANFRSFLHRQAISFAASSDRSRALTHVVRTDIKPAPWLSKTRVIFGPNGSGKSNLVAALATLRFLVCKSASCSAAEYAHCCTPFQSQLSLGAPTQFWIEVLIDGVRYHYFLAYDRGGIRFERLLAYKTGKPQQWFERHCNEVGEETTWAPFSPLFYGKREAWRKATRPQALFITTAAQMNAEQLRPFVDWIDTGMDILVSPERHAANRVASQIENPACKARVLELLNAVDSYVRDLRLSDNHPRAIEFLHDREGLGPTWLEPEYEAAGRTRLVILAAALLDSLGKGNFVAIDEFDLGVHPLVARYLMQLVNKPKFAATRAQVLLTSHDVGLLSLEVLRREEIYLMELAADRSSKLSSIRRTGGPRKHEKIAKGYLSGKFGGIPEIRPDT